MIIFQWFDATDAKKFGTSLAQFFVERVPKSSHFGDKAFTQKVNKILQQMAVQVAQFKRSHKLNTYKKAQLSNAFKWALRDASFDQEYTDKLTKWLVIQVG